MAPTDDVLIERPADGTAVVVFSGEHDLASAPEVRKLLDSLLQQDDLVVADFSSAKFVDSAILGVVLETLSDSCTPPASSRTSSTMPSSTSPGTASR